MERIWSRREKQLELMEKGTTGLYGDLEAIVGVSMPQIEALSLAYQLCVRGTMKNRLVSSIQRIGGE